MTSKMKTEIVLSLLRGEDAELLSREHGVTIADISQWRDQFVEKGTTGFKPKPENSRLSAPERKIGQLQMELELTKKERNSGKTKKEMISALIQERYSFTGKPYPKRLIFKVVGYSSSTWYEHPTARTGKRERVSPEYVAYCYISQLLINFH